ncbi:MAG: transketolase family protein [Candidatus Gastranaerophilales bacterium]|nr:transketolase family protein [Candidatus Gastranaerophilales bacterium]
MKNILNDNKNKQSMRNVYGETLALFGEKNKNIVVLDADLSSSTKTSIFAKKFPDRFFNVGIAEQNLITQACGLSLTGKKAYVSSFAMFATGRAWEQIRNTLCYNDLDVKIVATHCGLTVGEDGASHQALEDIAIMKAIPNMMIYSPCDAFETKKILEFSLSYNKPMYIRLSRCDVYDVLDNQNHFNPYKAYTLLEGNDATIISTGEFSYNAIKAAKILKEEKDLNIEVIHIGMIKPIDKESIIKAAQKQKPIFTLENHSVIGGLGSSVCDVVCASDYPCRVIKFGVNDVFGQSGTPDGLLEYYNLTPKQIANEIKKYLV